MRRRLALVSAAVTAMVVLAFVIPLAGLVRSLARDRVLVTAERDAQNYAQALRVLPEAGAQGAEALVDQVRLPGGSLITIALPDGTMVGAAAPFDENFARAAAGEAFRQPVEGGEAVYVPVFLGAESSAAVVRVFVAQEELTRNVAASWAILGALGVALIALAALVADRLARTVVEPVRELSQAAHEMGEGRLDVRVEPAGPPEVIEVANAFNRLGSRIRVLLSLEREAVADLSHRLRTPLTALRLDVDAVTDPDTSARLTEDLDELQRTVDHVINEARRPMREGPGAVSDLGAIVRSRVGFWGALADEQRRDWSSAVGAERYPVAAAPEDLAAAVDALLGNVLAHTPEETPFEVVVEWQGDLILLIVEDGGPGFADPSLVERGASAAGSTGLGLDIVRRTAEAGGGSLSIEESAAGGARVLVSFPAAGDGT